MPLERSFACKNNPIRWIALPAWLFFCSTALRAAPTEIPKLEPKVGSNLQGVSLAPVQSGPGSSLGSVGAPTLDGGSLLLPDAPVLAPDFQAVPLSAAPAAGPAAAPALPAASAPKTFGRRLPAPSAADPKSNPAAPTPAVGSKEFQRSLERVGAGSAKSLELSGREQSTPANAIEAGVVSAALFDLAAVVPAVSADAGVVPGGLGAAPTPAQRGLQPFAGNPNRVVIEKLRSGRVVSGRERGPASIAGIETIEFAGTPGSGNSGETIRVSIAGEPWFLKRIGDSPDAEIAAMTAETRAMNEVGVSAMLRVDPLLSRSYSVSEKVLVFRDGKHVFVLSKSVDPSPEQPSGRKELSPAQRADASIVQLVLGLSDLHASNVLLQSGGGAAIIDFEKLSRSPMGTASAQQIDTEVMIKNFPLVDRLSQNDPDLYRARFEEWKRDYDAGGRDRMDSALRESGWSASDRAAYLSAVDRNAASYLERLQPYLEYANGWHRTIQANKAEAAQRQAEAPKGFFANLFGGGGKKGFGTAARGVDLAGRGKADARVDALLAALRGAGIGDGDLLHFTDANGLVGILSSGKLFPSMDPARGSAGPSNAVHGDGAYFARGRDNALYHLDKDGRATLRHTLRETGSVSVPVALRVKPGAKLRVGAEGPDGVPVLGPATLNNADLAFLYARLPPEMKRRLSAKNFAEYAARRNIGGVPLSALERFDAAARKWVPLESSWRALKRGFGFGAPSGRGDADPASLGWSDWASWKFAGALERAGRLASAAARYEALDLLSEAARAYDAAKLPAEAARVFYADYGRSGRFRSLLEAESRLKRLVYGGGGLAARAEDKALLARVRSAVRTVAEAETERLAANAELELAEGRTARAAESLRNASEMAAHFSFERRRALSEQTAEPPREAPPAARTQGRGLSPEEIPDGLLGEKAMESFFSERLVAAREKTAATLASLQRGVEDGIVFFGDNQGKTDAIENARRLKERFDRAGERVLIVSGHGGPLVEGQKMKGTHLLDANGRNAAWFPDNAWGGLELLDVLRRIGVSLTGYQKIVFAACHGGSACGVSEAVDVPVLGTDRDGWLHYSSNLVVNPENGRNYGMFLRDEEATKLYRRGREDSFETPLQE